MGKPLPFGKTFASYQTSICSWLNFFFLEKHFFLAIPKYFVRNFHIQIFATIFILSLLKVSGKGLKLGIQIEETTLKVKK
jgi:hypothetical protein